MAGLWWVVVNGFCRGPPSSAFVDLVTRWSQSWKWGGGGEVTGGVSFNIKPHIFLRSIFCSQDSEIPNQSNTNSSC